MITAKVRSNMRFPRFNFHEDLAQIAKRIIIPELARGIDANADIEGKRFPALEPETIRQKGHSRPLINEGKLHRSFIFKRRDRHSVVITLRADRKEIGKFLQINGIQSKRGTKHFNFFGITDIMEKLAVNFMRQKIQEAIDRRG